jgi:ubiquinol-cytochrome c reductase cytochrome c subunit
MGGIMRYLCFPFGVAALAAGIIAGQGTALAAGSAEKGEIAFLAHGCWQCHGVLGQGSVATSNGKVLAPDLLPFEVFESFVRTTNGQMPPYREAVLTSNELVDIYAYLQSIPKSPDYKSIPLLNPDGVNTTAK